MHTFFPVLFSLAASAAAGTSGLSRSHAPIPSEMGGATQHYVGTVVLEGRYQEGLSGDLCFLPRAESLRHLLVVPHGAEVCFSNEEQAQYLLGVGAAVSAIDTTSICGMDGKAKILISGLWVGRGDASMWYTTKLVRVLERSRPRLIACGG